MKTFSFNAKKVLNEMKQGNSPSNSTLQSSISTSAISSDSSFLKHQQSEWMQRTIRKDLEMQEIEEYIDYDDEFRYGFTYYLKACFHLDKSTKKSEGRNLLLNHALSLIMPWKL